MSSNRTLFLLGRILLSAIFVLSGISKITGWTATAGYMTSKGMPAVPLFLTLAIVVEIGGGLSLLLGIRPKWGAGILALYMIPTTLIFHNFWALSGAEAQGQLVQFLKNLAILGGLVTVTALPRATVASGRYLRRDSPELTDRRVA